MHAVSTSQIAHVSNFSEKYLYILLYIIRSNILEKHRWTDIGLQLPKSLLSLALYIGATIPVFKLSGNIPLKVDRLNICNSGSHNFLKEFLTTV